MQIVWHSWLVGFGLTLALELPIVFFMLRGAEPRWGARLQVALLANLATHPLVWYFFPMLPIGYAARLSLSEFWAFGVEAWIYAAFLSRHRLARAVTASLVANATSFGLGWIIVLALGHWLF